MLGFPGTSRLNATVPWIAGGGRLDVANHQQAWRWRHSSPGDPEVQALHLELQGRQRAADVALLREFAPTIPEHELEPLGETIRSSLYGLALLWLDHPELDRETLVAAMLRVVRGILLTAGGPAQD